MCPHGCPHDGSPVYRVHDDSQISEQPIKIQTRNIWWAVLKRKEKTKKKKKNTSQTNSCAYSLLLWEWFAQSLKKDAHAVHIFIKYNLSHCIKTESCQNIHKHINSKKFTNSLIFCGFHHFLLLLNLKWRGRKSCFFSLKKSWIESF